MPQIQCCVCENSFYVKPNRLKKGWGKYCSKKCQYEGQKIGRHYPCATCSKKVYRNNRDLNKSKSNKFFCSKSCQAIWRNKDMYKGEYHVNWKGGSASYRSILSRTDIPQECLKCGCIDKRVLAVHHKDRNRNNNAVSNLIWLCHNCHFLVHYYEDEAADYVVPVA